MMFEYKKLNDLAGWTAFLISLIVYSITVEDTASFWDAGEFIAVSSKLEVPHPPGAPFYLLLGRFFSMFAFGVPENIAIAINFLSVVSSAFTILFLFWTITYLASKIIDPRLNNNNKVLAILAGFIGSLSFTFTDSFWFSAVESEVYAMSSFFTAFVFWLSIYRLHFGSQYFGSLLPLTASIASSISSVISSFAIIKVLHMFQRLPAVV